MTTLPMPDSQAQPEARLFSLRGRLGRVHYIAYSLGAIVGVFLLMLLAGYALILSGKLGRMLYVVISVLLLYGFLPIFFTMLTVKRAHDFNMGGWIALLLLVPVVNFMFWIIPGSRGDNNYGARPERASSGIRLFSIILPILLIAAFMTSQGNRFNVNKDAPATQKPNSSLKPYTP